MATLCGTNIQDTYYSIEWTIVSAIMDDVDKEFQNLMNAFVDAAKSARFFGAIVRKIFNKHYNEYIPQVIHWKISPSKKFNSQVQHIPSHKFYAGTPPMNRGRHFNRRPHRKLK